MKLSKPASVEEYINRFPVSTQKILNQVRATIQKAAPAAEESISYAMPAYSFNGKPLVYFAGYDHHIGFYATPNGHEAFKNELSVYKQGKGSVQFPIDKPMPVSLITKIVKFRLQSIKEKSPSKKTK